MLGVEYNNCEYIFKVFEIIREIIIITKHIENIWKNEALKWDYRKM